MNSSMLQRTAIDHGGITQYTAKSRLVRVSPRLGGARLRRKRPTFWIGLALLVLTADALLAVIAWAAVDFILN